MGTILLFFLWSTTTAITATASTLDATRPSLSNECPVAALIKVPKEIPKDLLYYYLSTKEDLPRNLLNTLAVQAQRGDRDALNLLAQEVFRISRIFAMNNKATRIERDEIAQVTAIGALQNLHNYDPKRSFLTFVTGVFSHKVVDLYRSKAKQERRFGKREALNEGLMLGSPERELAEREREVVIPLQYKKTIDFVLKFLSKETNRKKRESLVLHLLGVRNIDVESLIPGVSQTAVASFTFQLRKKISMEGVSMKEVILSHILEPSPFLISREGQKRIHELWLSKHPQLDEAILYQILSLRNEKEEAERTEKSFSSTLTTNEKIALWLSLADVPQWLKTDSDLINPSLVESAERHISEALEAEAAAQSVNK